MIRLGRQERAVKRWPRLLAHCQKSSYGGEVLVAGTCAGGVMIWPMSIRLVLGCPLLILP